MSYEVLIALSLSLAAVAYNNIANHWKPFHGPAYIPLGLSFTAIMLLIAAVALDLSRIDLGLRGDIADLRLPLLITALFVLTVFPFAGSARRGLIADRRVTHLRGSALAFYVLVRIPVGTAVVEEVLFRGVLFAAWRAAGASTLNSALCASAAFGLWHVVPTMIAVRANHPAAARQKMWAAVAGAIAFTFLAGLGLTWLRVDTGGVLAPVVLHAAINSTGALAAVKAGSDPSEASS